MTMIIGEGDVHIVIHGQDWGQEIVTGTGTPIETGMGITTATVDFIEREITTGAERIRAGIETAITGTPSEPWERGEVNRLRAPIRQFESMA